MPMVSSPTISCQKAMTPMGSPITHKWKPCPVFVEIARSLWGNDSPHITINIPPGLTTPHGLLVRTATASMVSTRLHQNVVSGPTYLDMVTTSMSLVSLEVTPMVVDHPMPTLEGGEDSESDYALPPSHNHNFCWVIFCPSPRTWYFLLELIFVALLASKVFYLIKILTKSGLVHTFHSSAVIVVIQHVCLYLCMFLLLFYSSVVIIIHYSRIITCLMAPWQ